uniref:BPTI/Kunitz inhibitor domain-containing protein n=1 Tax=Romanomermis culicivorax TaxID=13658 RepID=A0A915K1C7_ROMCU
IYLKKYFAASNPCTQLKSRGTGSSNILRFYYDHRTRQCDSFFYTGVEGNQNNFLTKDHCEQACAVSKNPCRRGIPYMIDRTSIKCYTDIPCPSHYWCHYGSTRDSSVCCQIESLMNCYVNENPCALKLETGEGDSELNRWYFDTRSQQCLAFTYKGNKGNQNQFLTKLDCNLACGRAYIDMCPHGEPVKSLDGSLIKCFQNVGNSCPPNSWCHLGDSDDTNICCTGTNTDICERSLNHGFGGKNLDRFYYDKSSRSCLPFMFGGHKGNGNNFQSLKECEETCLPP